MQVSIDANGTIRYLAHEGQEFLPGTTKRASWIYPQRRAQRVLFWLCRLGGDKTLLAAWTRRWQCKWMVDLALSDGPVLGPFPKRSEAIEAEENWILERL